MKKIDLFIILSFIIISFFALKDLFKPGFYTSHDGPHQVVRMYYFDKLIRDGQIPPRFVPGLFNGFGYPLFNFSYHMPWIIAEPLLLSGFSVFDGIKTTFLIGFILSGITMYFYQKAVFGRLPATVGTFLYLFAPYRFSNIFVRAAIGDATIFIFPPLAFLAIYKLSKANDHKLFWVGLGAVAIACALLSHAMVFIFFFASYALYIIFNMAWIEKRINFLRHGLLTILMGAAISAYYLIPSIIEKKYTVFSQIFQSAFSQNKFTSLAKLFYSPWGYGTVDATQGAMSLQLGIAQWLVVFLSTLAIVYMIVKKTAVKDVTNRHACFFLIVFICSTVLMLPISSEFWVMFGKILTIDFAWRGLALSVFAVSILAGYFIKATKYKTIFAVLLILLAFYGNRNHLRINQSLDWSIPFFLKLERTTNSFDEYTPLWVNKDYLKDKQESAKFSNPQSDIKIIKETSNQLILDVSSKEAGRLRVNTIYFPGWNGEINGKVTKIDYNDGGLMDLNMERGTSRVILKFTETPLRVICDYLSVISFLTAIILMIRYRKAL